MGHIPVPWFIGGEAHHSERVARLMAYNAVGGRQGVLGPFDCMVKALAVPGQALQVMPGAYSILAQHHPYEAYVGMIDTADVVPTTPTGSSGGRSDLVVLSVQDPNDVEEGFDQPPDPQNGPYVITEIITGVPATTTTFASLNVLGSSIAIARIDWPANTATLQQAYIKDLRGSSAEVPGSDPVGTPPAAASQSIYRAYQSVGTADLTAANSAAAAITWPSGAAFPIDVPDYATSFAFDFDVKNCQLVTGNVQGILMLKVTCGSYVGYSTASLFDLNYTGSVSTETVSAGGSFLVPAAIRGQRATFALQGQFTAGYPGTLRFTLGSYFKMWITFKAGSVIE